MATILLNFLKTPESELSADNNRQICNYGEKTIQPPPIMEEVENEKLKNNISPGLDNLQAELLKYGGKEMVNKLHIILHIWIMEEIPKDWSKNIACQHLKRRPNGIS
jgi:hypothetical protein